MGIRSSLMISPSTMCSQQQESPIMVTDSVVCGCGVCGVGVSVFFCPLKQAIKNRAENQMFVIEHMLCNYRE